MFDLTSLFIKAFNLSLSAGWIALFVILLRFVLRKAPKWINCVWWLLVGLRLVFPISIESIFSLIPSSEVVSPDIIYSASPSVSTGIPALNTVINPIIENSFTPDPSYSVNPLQVVAILGSYLWLMGVAVMLIYTVVCYVALKRKMRFAVKSEGNIYESENVESPFILGIIKPKIYLPFGLSDENRSHIIAHEKAHLKRKDHLIKPVAFLILSVYWFNPLMWISYVLLCRDIEMACDERAIKNLETEKRREYSLALLQNSTHRKLVAACPLAFGEVGVKQRIKSVMNYKKPAFWVIIIALIVSVVASVCLLTNPVKAPDIEKGYYRETELVYSERVTDYVSENIYGITEENQLYIIDENGITADIGIMEKTNLTSVRLENFTYLSEAPDFNEITVAYVVRDWDGEDGISDCTLHYVFRTEHNEIFMVVAYADSLWLDAVLNEDGEAEIGEVGQIKVKSIRKLQYLGEDYRENIIIREISAESSERDFAIEMALLNQLDPPEDTFPDMPYTAVSFHVLGKQKISGTVLADEYSKDHVNTERYAVIFARYRYTYEDGQIFESGEANRAILEFSIESDGSYALVDCKEFILDGSEAAFEKQWDMMVSDTEYDSEQLTGTLTYECRVKAMEYYHIAYWTYAPMLSYTGAYACPITFSVDYDKAVLSCSGGSMVKEKYTEKNEEGTEMTYDRADTPVWCPVASDDESGKAADSAEISFTLYKNGRKIHKGTISIENQKAFTHTLGTIYVLEMKDNKDLIMAEGPTVRIGVRANEVRFYKERVLETESDRVVLSVHYLLPSEIEKLNEIMDTASWINVDYANRSQLSLDGKFTLEDKVVFFSDEINVLYSHPYYAEIESEDMDFIMSLQGRREYLSDLDGLSSKLTLTLLSKFFEFSSHPLSSEVYYGYYEETEDEIVLKDDETEGIFTFTKSDGKLIFDADKSSEIPQYKGVANLEDGAMFSQ